MIYIEVYQLRISKLGISEVGFLHFGHKKLFKHICTAIIFRIRIVVGSAVGEDASHVRNKDVSGGIILTSQSFTHCFQVC